MFEAFYAPEAVQKVLVPQDSYHPFPKYGEPNTLTEEQKTAMIRAGEEFLGYGWPVAAAMDYMKFRTEGTREPYERRNYSARRAALSLLIDAEYAEQKGRFIPDIINGMWAIMDEATWVVPAHNGLDIAAPSELPDFDKPVIIDLFSAGTAGMLASAYYLFKAPIDAVSPLVLRRLEIVMNERIFRPFMENYYWWSGMFSYKPNNWNPWILSNVIYCFGTVCKDEDLRAAGISRSVQILDRFLDNYTIDGGCDEGPGYWGAAGASLYDCLMELTGLTGGAFDRYFDELLIQNIGRYIYRVHIVGPYFTNYADAPRHIRTSYGLIYRYGRKIHDQDMMRLGVALQRLYKKNPGREGIDMHRFYRHLESILGESEISAAEDTGFPLLESVFIDGIQLMAARQQKGSPKGLYLSAKGGNNDESHNHNDVGSFIVYSDEAPVFIDIGSGMYNAKTFGPQRYEIPQMQSSYHNLPEINGVMQHNGEEYAAADVSYRYENGLTVFSEDIAKAYPEEAGAEKWTRTFTFDRKAESVTITDEAVFTKDSNVVETMFITPAEPVINGDTVTVAGAGGRPVRMVCEGSLSLTVEKIDLSYDMSLNRNYNGAVWRIRAKAECGGRLRQSFILTQI